ncbi:zinc knuckle CX2CX4HX4C containing protein [Tanacetum coccineum]
MNEVDIEDLTIEQYFRMTQESQIPKKVDDMTIAEYLEYEEAMKTHDYDEYQPHSAKADASQSPVHPKITKTTGKYTREVKEQSNQGLGDWFEAELEKCWKIQQKRDDSNSNLRSLADPKHANIIVKMADKTRCVSQGIVENVMVKIDKFSFTSDFLIIDTKELHSKTIILGRPFLANIRAEINISTREVSLRIKEDKDNKLGGQIQEKILIEEQEDPKKCGETKERAIIGAMVNKLPEEWFSEVSRDKDDLEGIIDYLEPILYDGFIYYNDEAYKQRRNKLLGMPYTEPPPIKKEEAKINKYNLGAGEIFTKTKILNIKEFPRTTANIADIRAEIIEERKSSSEDLSNTKRRHWCKPIYQWKDDVCTKWASCNPHFDECDGGDNPRENKEYWESSNNDIRTTLEWESLSFDNWVRVAFGKNTAARRQFSRPT